MAEEASSIAPKAKDLLKTAKKAFEGSNLDTSAEEDTSLQSEDLESTEDSVEEPEDAPPEEFELKVNGKTYKAKDLNALKAMAQRGIATQQAVEKERAELQRFRKEAEEAVAKVNALAKTPVHELFARLDPQAARDAAYKLLENEAKEAMEMEGMSEREKALYVKAKEADKYRDAQQKEATTRQEREMATLVAQQEAQISGTLSQALAESGYKISPGNTIPVRVASALYRAAIEKGVDLSPRELAAQVKAQMDRINDSFYGNMDAATFIQRHPKLADQVRDHYAKGSGVKPKSAVKRDPDSGKFKQTQKRTKSDDFEEMIRRMKDEGRKELQKNGQPFSLD